jgi:hypothetical protein
MTFLLLLTNKPTFGTEGDLLTVLQLSVLEMVLSFALFHR